MELRVQALERGADAGRIGEVSAAAPVRRRFGAQWASRRIDVLAEVDPENLPNSTDPEFVFNYISLDHVDAGRLLNYSRESFATAPSRARRVLRTDDVLMSTVRPALQGHLLFSDQVPNAVCSTGFAVLRTNRQLCDPRFLFAHLFGDVVGAQVQKLLAGSNYPAINSGDVGKLRVTCPPTVAEQHAIAVVLSDMDALIGSLEALVTKKRAIKRAAMQQLLTGRKRLPGFEGKWEARRLGEVSTIAMGRTPSRSVPAYWGGKHMWLAVSDLKGKVITKSRERITDLAADQMRTIPAGTLLMSFKLSIGRVGFAGRPLYTNEAICSLTRLSAQADYLYYALPMVDFSLYGRQAVKGHTLNSDSLAQVKLSLPPLPEQRAIATVLSDMDDEISALKRRLDKTRAIKRGMMQQLLTGAVRLPIPMTDRKANCMTRETQNIEWKRS